MLPRFCRAASGVVAATAVAFMACSFDASERIWLGGRFITHARWVGKFTISKYLCREVNENSLLLPSQIDVAI
jgi:hypothetical protein